jgi:hypothetical protein
MLRAVVVAAPFAVMLINLLAPMFGLVVTRPFGWKKGDK